MQQFSIFLHQSQQSTFWMTIVLTKQASDPVFKSGLHVHIFKTIAISFGATHFIAAMRCKWLVPS